MWRFPAELSSTIKYLPVEPDPENAEKEVEYRLNGKRLSEFITLDRAPEEAPVYSYRIGGTLVPSVEGSTVLFLNADGETVLKFSAPYMADAKGEICYDFEISAEQDEEGYIYRMIPSEEWLCSAEREFPVVIDPDVRPEYDGTITDTIISETNKSKNYLYIDGTIQKLDRIKVAGSEKYRSLIKISKLPSLSAGDVILQSYFALSRYDAGTNVGKEIDAYRVRAVWDESNVTWSNFYSNSNAVDTSRVESFIMTRIPTVYNPFNYLDLTNLVKNWYAGTYTAEYDAINEDEQYSVILQLASGVSNGYTEFRSAEYNNTYSISPYFSIIYVNSTGLESRFSYSSQGVGRAGTGSVNLFSGNLTVSFADAEINNGTMPISVSHVYNANDKDTDIGYGNGWRLNYAQYITAVSIPNNSETATYYEYIDGDGTRHYYKKDTGNKYVNELDKDSVLTVESNGTLTIKDKGDNKLVFQCSSFDHDNNSSTANEYRGHLIRIEDANGNETRITYSGSSNTELRITSISEKLHGNSSSGQSISFTYTNDHLSAITVPNGLGLTYTYSSAGCLTSVGYTDGNNTLFSFDSDNRITCISNIDGYNVSYTYDAANRVIEAAENNGSADGNYLTYEYGWNATKVLDNLGRDTIYQFNNAGQAVSIRNTEGQAVYAAYNTGDRTITQFSAVSKMQETTVNLLKDHGFANNNQYNDWAVSGSEIVSEKYHIDRYSASLPQNSYIEQSVAVESEKTYTASAYFTGVSGGVISVLNGTTVIAHSDPVEVNGTDWYRGSTTFTVPTGVTSIKVRLSQTASGTAYADSVQLESGSTPNRYNLIENSDFSDGYNGFNLSSGISSSTDTVVSDTDPLHPEALSDYVFKIVGSTATPKHVFQSIFVSNGQKGDTYSFGGWCRSDSAPLTTQYDVVNSMWREYGLKCLKVQFYNGSTFLNECTAYFAADTNEWQYTCSSAVAGANYTKVRLIACFDYTRNEAYFDGLQLYREQFSQSYTYDSNGNLTGYLSLIGQNPTLTYDSNNNVTSSKDALNHTTTYTYDSHHNLLTSTSPTGVVTTNTYDTNGSVTSTKVGNSTDYIKTSTTYDSASALATAVTDARGNSVTYGYDSTTRQQTSITDPKGNVSTYSYGYASSMLRLASLTSDGTGTVNYTYDTYGKLTQIGRGITNYSFTYDSWGRVVDTKVGTTAISTNNYDAYGRLESVEYANDYKTEYEYDDLDRVVRINQGLMHAQLPMYAVRLAYEFIYNNEGDLYELRNFKTKRSTFFEYDHAGRCMASTEKTFTCSGSTITGYTGTVAGYKYEYDLNNSLTSLKCTLNDTEWTTTYTYDADNRPTVTHLDNNVQITDAYDGIGRISSRTIGLANDYTTNITYVSGANGSKTALVSTYKNGNDNSYSYSYDANGNITSITKGSQSFTYVYDAANQLVRENLYYGSGNSNNATYTYTYDQWGNISEIRKHTYTTGQTGTGILYGNYSYSDSAWGDLLTSYNLQTISYDSMGNPTSYLGATLGWNGKQLISYSKGSNNIQYSYNEDGLRLKKMVNHTDTNYYYNGSVLMAMTSGTIYQRFSYDASGKVVSVDYSENSGSSYTTYYYLRNAQGDIVKLIDGSGTTVVEYSYDSWGKKISTTGTLATSLGANQPFRYRSYVYDKETGWYYLQSRYYDPSTGRFISADVYLSTGQGVIGHNAYAYCYNSPIMLFDSNGCTPANVIGALVGAIGGAVIGTAIANYFNLKGWQRWLAIGGTAGLLAVVGWFAGPAVYAAVRSVVIKAIEVGTLAAGAIKEWVLKALGIGADLIDKCFKRGIYSQIANDLYTKYRAHIFAEDHGLEGLVNKLGERGVFNEAFRIASKLLSQAQNESNEIHAIIYGVKVTIRFWVQNGKFSGSFNMFAGWATRIIGKLLEWKK